jgi:uncharacterized protein YcbX
MTAATIAALNVYPVKSCRGIALARAAVTVRGLRAGAPPSTVGDREWMIVDNEGAFVTQREHPRLALIGTAVADGELRLSGPDRAPLAVPLRAAIGAAREVRVWESRVSAHDAGDAAAAWLSAFLGIAVRLVRFDPQHERRCNPAYAGESGAHTAFADGYPILVIGAASLAELNAHLAMRGEPPLPMNRFRPNVVIAGLDAHAEDHLATIAVDGVVLQPVKPCTRCQITTTDQDTALRGIEPLSTLASYRHDATLGGVTFGMNAIVVAGAGREIVAGSPAICTYRF